MWAVWQQLTLELVSDFEKIIHVGWQAGERKTTVKNSTASVSSRSFYVDREQAVNARYVAHKKTYYSLNQKRL